jgi:outer membrane receptor protein involved in Fe transport
MRKSNLRATAAWQALALLGAGVLAAPAMAQDAPPASGETSPAAEAQPALSPEGQAQASDEAIVVTGSRLVRPELDAPSPVTTVDSETFDLTGTVTVESLLNELPQIIPGNTRVSNNQGGEDFSTLDLRGLGPNRTLILVDGERVPASSSSGVVDIGTIPAGLIERVDVVTGGASAVYGSDAIAGVVNFILKDNYEGLEVSSQYGISDHGDGASFNIQGLLGGNFGDDRGNMTMFASYYTRDAVGQGDRNLFRNAAVVVRRNGVRVVTDHLHLEPGDVITGAGGSGTPPWGWITNDANNPFTGLAAAETLVGNTNFNAGNTNTDCDPTTVGAAFNTGNLSFNNLGQLAPRNTSGLCNFADRSVGSSRYNFNPVNYLVTPYKRYNLAGTARYDISDAIRLKVIGNYTDSTQEVNLAPTPATGIVVPFDSPMIPADLAAALATRPDPTAPFVIDRRFSETGPRIGIFNAKTQTLRGTLSGPLAHGFNWDATASYGKTTDNIKALGNINYTAVQQGLNGCPTASLPGCVPLDIFGPNTIDDEMLSFVRIDTKEVREFDQVRVAGNITGNLVDLPAGPIGIAIGAEARTDRGDVKVDDAQRTGNIYGFNAVNDQHGKVNVKELYGEVRVPILADLPFVHEFSIEAGARFSDYSSAGGLFNWKLGAQWAPTDWLKIRGIFNKAARAPSIVELFQNGDQGFPSYTDPCNASNAPTGSVLAACQAAAPAINFTLPDSDPAAFHQNNDQVQAFAFGNPDLSEETAKTFTIGAVLTPNLGLGRFSATVDYYNIKIDDIISAFGAQFFIDDCYLRGVASSCDRVIRRTSDGQIDRVNSATGNQGTFKTSGIDGALNFSVPFSDVGLGIGGRFRFQELISWLDKIDFGGGNFAGFSGGGIGGTFPEWKSTMTVAYDSDDFTAQMRWNYLSETEEAFGDDAVPGRRNPVLPSLSYFDLSLRKSIGNNFELTGILNNVFGAKPKQTPAGDSGFRVNATYYNPIILGRYFTIQAKVKM